MTDYELKNIAPEDIEDVLVKVETSFDIKFVAGEFAHIKTLGQLCNHILHKIQVTDSGDCTSQQAFYKLRAAILSTLQIDHKTISTNFPLADLLPRKSRRSRVKKLEEHLGFKLNILRPPHWVTGILTISFFASIMGVFFNWQLGLLGLGFSMKGFWLANKIGNEIDLETVGQVAKKMTIENYSKSRRNPNTFNKKEIEKVLTDLFSTDLYLDKSKLTTHLTQTVF